MAREESASAERQVGEGQAVEEHHAPGFEDEQLDFQVSELGVEDPFTFVLFWALAIVVFVQFFTRYVLNDSIAWTEEIARYLLVAVTFLGATIAVRKNSHIHVEFFYRYLSRPVSRTLSTLVDLIRIAFLIYAAYLTWKVLQLMGNQRMASVDLPIGLLYWVVLIGLVAMTVRALQVAWRHWREGKSELEGIERPSGPTT